MPEIDRPFFSILVPATRDKLVGFSIRTILEQDFTDFEIILSHNVAADAPGLNDLADDPRIRYVRPPSQLLIHDSWEFALSHARGRWIMLLGDDDGYLPGALSLLAAAIAANHDSDIFIWKWGSYTYPDWVDKREAGFGVLPAFSGESWKVDTKEYLDIIFAPTQAKASVLKQYLPSIMRGAYRKDVVDQIVAETGRLFHLITPDYGAMTCMLAHCRHYVMLDAPLTILGSSRQSYGSATIGGSNLKQKFYEAVGNPVFRHTRAQDRVANRAAIFETIMRVREMYPERLGTVTPDVISFLHWHKQGLEEAQTAGGDTAAGLLELERLVLEMQPGERAEYQRLNASAARTDNPGRRFGSLKSGLRKAAIRLLIRLMPLSKSVLRRIVRRDGLRVRGAKHEMHDVLAFCRFAGQVSGHLESTDLQARPIRL